MPKRVEVTTSVEAMVSSCPYCGSDSLTIGKYIRCDNCKMTGPVKKDSLDAVKAWNSLSLVDGYFRSVANELA